MSQLGLATAAGVSARHVSFVESGRAKPSRTMVLALARALDIPMRERNALLRVAGFSEVYNARPFEGGPELARVRLAVRFMLARLQPYPCIALDTLWNLVEANGAAWRLITHIRGSTPPLSGPNVARLLFSEGAKKSIVNWEEFAGAFVQRLHREGLERASSRDLVAELLSTPGWPRKWAHPDLDQPLSPFVPLVVREGLNTLTLFTAITTLGTPLDMTMQGLRLETYFPADDATDRALHDAADVEHLENGRREATRLDVHSPGE
jgi:transcriptional regulator with XRE-family HTH domain